MGKRIGLLGVVLCVLFVSLAAQQVTGSLEGRVLDPDGQPLAGVRISLSGASLQGIREVKTDERGRFRFFSVPVGTFEIRVRHEAFLDAALKGVGVRLGATTSAGDIRLKQKAVDAGEVVVTAERPAIDLSSTSTGGNLDVEAIKNLPVARDYRSVMALLPGANQSYYGDEVNVSGATGSENAYFVDGIDVSDPYMRLHNMRLPYNFIREIEIRTGGYEAEYRSSLGGMVNAVTYSGGNEFHGQVFGFFTNNNFSQSASRSELEPNRGDFSQYDFGFSLGGAIVRDKLWFFGAFNMMTEKEEVLIPGLDYYNDQLTQNVFAGKLTWRQSPRANLTLTAIADPAKRDAVSTAAITQALNADPMLAKVTQGGINILASGNYMFSDKIFLEASVSYIDRRDRSDPATERGREEIWYIDQLTGVYAGGQWGPSYGDSRQTTIAGKMTFVLGAHLVKAGFEYRDNALESYADQKVLNYFGDWYGLMTFHESGTVRNRIPSLFLQDSWSLGERWKLNFGLRWSGEYWIGSDGKVAQSIPDEFQPRLGLVYQTGRNSDGKIFASYGRFYQEVSTLLLTWYALEGSDFRMTTFDHDPRLDPSGGSVLVETGGQIQDEIKGLQGQNYDEFTLGFEQPFRNRTLLRVRGIYRNLRDGIEDCAASDGTSYCANPGRAPLDELPKMERRYYGLELTVAQSGGKALDYQISYTLSRSTGNYPGLFAQDQGDYRPNVSGQFDTIEALTQASGLLPNDRPHVLKIFGSCRLPFGLSAGVFFLWQSGTPLSDVGSQTSYPGYPKFLSQRGSNGRTPSIADLNLRLSYQIRNAFGTGVAPRIVFDLFHIGSSRKPVTYIERHYLNVDELGNQIDPNPLYMHPSSYFPPMSGRLGLEIGF